MHENTYTGGRLQRIASLVKEGSHRLEAWGNKRDGFEAYLVSGDAGVSVSQTYRRLIDLKNDALEQYGDDAGKVHKGRNWL